MPKTSEQEFCVKLVEAIEKYPCLYNYKLPDYSRRDVVEKAWAEVAGEVNEKVTTCKEKWKNVRTVFVRSLKLGHSGETRRAKKPYYLYDILRFLLPFVRVGISSTENDEEDNEYEADGAYSDSDPLLDAELKTEPNDTTLYNTECTQHPAQGSGSASRGNASTPIVHGKKRKASSVAEVDRTFIELCRDGAGRVYQDHEENPTKMFLLSLMPDLQEMNPNQLRQFKIEVLGLIDEILTK